MRTTCSAEPYCSRWTKWPSSRGTRLIGKALLIKPLDQPDGSFGIAKSILIALTIAIVGVLYIGILPGPFVDWIKGAAEMLLAGL